METWLKDLLKDKTLYQIFCSSRRGRLPNTLYEKVILIPFFISVVVMVVLRVEFNQLDNPQIGYRLVHMWADRGLETGGALLGFLIGAFAIFAALTDKKLYLRLAQKKNNSLTRFQEIYYRFLYIFLLYLTYMFITLLVSFTFVPHSPVWYWGKWLRQFSPILVDSVLLFTGAVIFFFSIFLLLLVASFLRNLYQAIIITIFWQKPEKENKHLT